MKTTEKINHSWTQKGNDYFWTCKNCGLRKKIKKEKITEPDGSTRLKYSQIYFLANGKEVKNEGCKDEETNRQLNFFGL